MGWWQCMVCIYPICCGIKEQIRSVLTLYHQAECDVGLTGIQQIMQAHNNMDIGQVDMW